MGHPPLETELKIPVPGLEPVRAALRGLKAEKVHHMAREVNVLLDTEDDRLQTSGRALRLRRYGDRHLFTLKGPVSYRGTIKVRQENEVEVEDAERLQTILEDLVADGLPGWQDLHRLRYQGDVGGSFRSAIYRQRRAKLNQ